MIPFSGYQVVVIGCSAGGFAALKALLAGIPAGFPAALVVASHLASGRSRLAELLASRCGLPVREGGDQVPVEPGTVYVSVPDYHLLLEPDMRLALSVDERVNHCRPSVDVLFESASDSLGPNLIGVVLTGANADGAHGLKVIRSRGGVGIVQDPADAEVKAMPEAAIALAGADHILPVNSIPPLLEALVGARA